MVYYYNRSQTLRRTTFEPSEQQSAKQNVQQGVRESAAAPAVSTVRRKLPTVMRFRRDDD